MRHSRPRPAAGVFPAVQDVYNGAEERPNTNIPAVSLACLAALLAFLVVERLLLGRARRRVGLRIAVTGIRGKSSVTRLIAGGLRRSGRRVLAKATGSSPVLIFPDGREEGIERRGRPSVREQIRLMSLASRLGAEALVVETMSVAPENLSAELKTVIKPHVLALTNVRPDHLDDLGCDESAIARSLVSAMPRDCLLVVPESEARPEFATAAREASGLILRAPGMDGGEGVPGACFRDNIGLALAVLDRLGVDRETALAGMRESLPDPGALAAWDVPIGSGETSAVCYSVFAANDPRSSAEAVAMIAERPGDVGNVYIGLLCLREDRGDRTLQWIEAAASGFFDRFGTVAVLGVPAPAFRRRLARAGGGPLDKFIFETGPHPREIMDSLAPAGGGRPVFIGLGNIIGLGEAFVEHWKRTGTPHVH